MTDDKTGQTPNYGHNDGAHVLPLSECAFDDFRPAIQAANFLATRKRLFPPGPWDEELVFLFGDEARATHDSPSPVVERMSMDFDSGGYYTLHGENSWAMVRCHTYRDRPGQCDSLHMDLWWRGINVLRDCGTYRYFVANRPDMERYYKSLAAHNTVELDGAEPFEEVTRFLQVPWPKAQKRHFVDNHDGTTIFEGERYDYDRKPWNVLHRRCVVAFPGDVWVMIDDVLGAGHHAATLRWHLLDAPYEVSETRRRVTLDTGEGKVALAVCSKGGAVRRLEVVRGRDERGNVQGFASTYYGFAEPIPVVEVEIAGALPLRVVSVFSPGEKVAVSSRECTGETERWCVSAAGRDSLLELVPPSRSATRIYVGTA